MHLLYFDDSGSVGNVDGRHVVLASLAVFEREPHWFSTRLEEIAARLWPKNPRALEFRGADIYSGRKHWRGIGKDERLQAHRDSLAVVDGSTHVRIFGAAVHKASVHPDEPMELAFECLCNRFDRFLGRLHQRGDAQRRLIILDDSSNETALQSLAHNFWTEWHRCGQLYNLSDVPLSVNSKATRMIQSADMIAYSLRRYYEKGDPSLFDIISPRLDPEGRLWA